jgi:hypothetical protein
MSANETKREMA